MNLQRRRSDLHRSCDVVTTELARATSAIRALRRRMGALGLAHAVTKHGIVFTIKFSSTICAFHHTTGSASNQTSNPPRECRHGVVLSFAITMACSTCGLPKGQNRRSSNHGLPTVKSFTQSLTIRARRSALRNKRSCGLSLRMNRPCLVRPLLWRNLWEPV